MMLARLREWLDESQPVETEPALRPLITLSYAQSLDGSLAGVRGRPTALSGPESTSATHMIRSRHEGILVGIGTVMADDPRLTVRPPSGIDPRPVVLDSRLQIPIESRLLQGDRRILILHGPAADRQRRNELRDLGAEPVEIPLSADGRLDPAAAMEAVKTAGISTLMVEGGGAVLASLIRVDLWDRAVITVVPRWIDGYRLPFDGNPEFRIRDVEWLTAGDDILCLGRRTA